ncbi:MurR/RpiR family transcriptional regulator [Scandinavium sp. H11S7]|uniref:MurR/RpiR family transcriptional regulator n=1 Tax=Scandinavium hiltneri TaxID=2926519 RepID=UPI0021659909|nr:MurR/RpiR family transcriptional regulator [Scandinavium hiltneri]MCS2157288.1 MurR/RpiR family transcriptional regulator [Scandinavium hiltneri]
MNSYHGTERIIYEYILQRANDIMNLSAKVIARDTFSTTTSVNRVCKKMGYASYTELRYKFGHDLHKVKQIDHPVNMDDNRLNETCHTLKNSKHIYLYAQGATLNSLNYLSRFLSLSGIPHLVLSDIHQLTVVSHGTLVVLSKSGETQSIIDLSWNARRKGIKVVAITSQHSSLAKIAGLVWPLQEYSNPVSLYQRESQLELMKVVDGIGCELLKMSSTVLKTTVA